MAIVGVPVPQLRHALRALLPPWLRRPVGDSFVTEGILTIYDLDAEYMRDALLARWPSYAPLDALPLIAADRLVPLDPDHEDPTITRVRLKLWRTLGELAGLPLGLLIGLQSAMGAPNFRQVILVTQRSLWYQLKDGAVGHLLGVSGFAPYPPAPYELGALWPTGAPPASAVERLRFSADEDYKRTKGASNWDWDSLSPVTETGMPTGAWVAMFAFPSGDWIEPAPAVGAGPVVGSSPGSVGLSAAPERIAHFRSILRRYKSSKTLIRWMIISFEGMLFEPTLPADGVVNPDGFFGSWSKIVDGEYVPSRFVDARYCDGA